MSLKQIYVFLKCYILKTKKIYFLIQNLKQVEHKR